MMSIDYASSAKQISMHDTRRCWHGGHKVVGHKMVHFESAVIVQCFENTLGSL